MILRSQFFRTTFLIFIIGCSSPKSGRDSTQGKNETIVRPNIILIMADDMGFSDLGCFGGEIFTPNLDRMAGEGIRFTNFFNASVCCPSRASLMTGLYPHQAGVGHMDADWGYDSYQGRIKHSVTTIAEVLSAAGYTTCMSGKWHLGTREGDNPWERGFEKFFGIPKGGGVYFWPSHLDREIVMFDRAQSSEPVVVQPDPATFYSTDAFTDFAVDQIDQLAGDERPFFLYLPYIAPHFPQQAPEPVVEKYLDVYAQGWDVIRQKRYARQQELGIIDRTVGLSPYEGLEWKKLSEDNQVSYARQMAVYAAQVDILDRNVGRILETLERNHIAENTLVVFLSDNGAQQNAPEGFERNAGAVFGSKDSFGGYARNWANVSNTPFRFFKHDQHFGGIATPFIARWPAVIDANRISRQVAHIMDIFPTCLSAAGIEPANHSFPIKFQNLEGNDLMPHIRDTSFHTERELYWEHKGNRAVRDGNWKLVSRHNTPWELYNVAEDPTELRDLAASYPDKARILERKYVAWAERAGVLSWPVNRKESTH